MFGCTRNKQINTRPMICCSQKTYFRLKGTHTDKVKGQEKSGMQKKPRISI